MYTVHTYRQSICALVLGRRRRLIADRISVNKRNKHFWTGMSSDLSAFLLCPASLYLVPRRQEHAPRCRLRCCSNRSDIFGATPAACQNCTNPWRCLRSRMEMQRGSRTGGTARQVDEQCWLSVRSTCSTVSHAGIQPISDSNSDLGPVEPLRSMACPHTHTHTHGHVCRAIHPAIDIRSRRCQPWIVAPLILPDLCA